MGPVCRPAETIHTRPKLQDYLCVIYLECRINCQCYLLGLCGCITNCMCPPAALGGMMGCPVLPSGYRGWPSRAGGSPCSWDRSTVGGKIPVKRNIYLNVKLNKVYLTLKKI